MKKIQKSIIALTIIFGLTVSSMQANAWYSENKTRMYDGWLIAAVDVDPGDWGSRAEYTGRNPLGLARLTLQSQIQGRDYRIRLFTDYASRSANGNIWRIRTGGSNAAGNTGNNYARAIGYYHTGGDKRVATSFQ